MKSTAARNARRETRRRCGAATSGRSISSGLSKAYGLPGLRIGWIVAPLALAAEVWGVRDYTTIAPGAVNDRLARVALAPASRTRLLARTRTIIRANYPIVKDWIDSHDGLEHAAPDAGAIVFVRYGHGIESERLATRLRDEQSVLLVPGDHFDMDGYLRIGFGSEHGVSRRKRCRSPVEFLDAPLTHAR